MPKNTSSTRESPADKAVLDATKAALEAGEDPFGDDEPIVKESIEERASKAKAEVDAANGVTGDAPATDEGEAGEGEAAADGEGQAAEGAEGEAEGAAATGDDTDAAATGDDTSEAADGEGDTADELDPSEPQPYRGPSVTDLEKKADELEAKIAAEHKKLMDGELDADAYANAIKPFQKEQREVVRQVARAEAKDEQLADYRMGVLSVLSTQARKQGIEYHSNRPGLTDAQKAAAAKNAKDYDRMLTAIANDPDNANRPFKALAQEAHSAVMALRGVSKARTTSGEGKPAAAADKPAAATSKPPARENGKGPATLRTVPSAGSSNANGAGDPLIEQGRALKGPAYEAWYSKLSAAQKAKLLDE